MEISGWVISLVHSNDTISFPFPATSNGANGDKYISVDVSTTLDLAGNTNNVAASMSFTYDTEAPYVVYSSVTSVYGVA